MSFCFELLIDRWTRRGKYCQCRERTETEHEIYITMTWSYLTNTLYPSVKPIVVTMCH